MQEEGGGHAWLQGFVGCRGFKTRETNGQDGNGRGQHDTDMNGTDGQICKSMGGQQREQQHNLKTNIEKSWHDDMSGARRGE